MSMIPTILKNLFKDEVYSSIKIMVIMCGISLMMVSFGFMVAMLVAVLGVKTVVFVGGTIAFFAGMVLLFNFLNGS